MELEELEKLKKALCTDAHRRIERLEAQLWWFITLNIGTLLSLLIYFIKGLVIK